MFIAKYIFINISNISYIFTYRIEAELKLHIAGASHIRTNIFPYGGSFTSRGNSYIDELYRALI